MLTQDLSVDFQVDVFLDKVGSSDWTNTPSERLTTLLSESYTDR